MPRHHRDGMCVDDANFMACALSQGEFLGDGVCSGPAGPCVPKPTATPSASPTITPSATPTATHTPQLPDGSSCATPSQCVSGFCVDGACCGTACDAATDRCDLPGREGVCVTGAPAPAASSSTLAAIGALLIGIAAVALRRMRTVRESASEPLR